jgi:hypothetical protein
VTVPMDDFVPLNQIADEHLEAKSKATESLAAITNSLSSRRFSAEAQVNIKNRYRTREIQLEHVKSS